MIFSLVWLRVKFQRLRSILSPPEGCCQPLPQKGDARERNILLFILRKAVRDHRVRWISLPPSISLSVLSVNARCSLGILSTNPRGPCCPSDLSDFLTITAHQPLERRNENICCRPQNRFQPALWIIQESHRDREVTSLAQAIPKFSEKNSSVTMSRNALHLF